MSSDINTTRITQQIVQLLRSIVDPFQGQPNDEQHRRALQYQMDRTVESIAGEGNYTVAVDWARSMNGTVPVDIEIRQPVRAIQVDFEINNGSTSEFMGSWTPTGRTYDDLINHTATTPPRRQFPNSWGEIGGEPIILGEPVDNEDAMKSLKSMNEYY